MAGRLAFSVVIPMKNEGGNVQVMVEEIAAACDAFPFEAIFVDDGSTDDTLDALQRAARCHDFVRIVRHDRSGGQSAALHSGVLAARSAVICTLDGDGQNPPAEIPGLVAPLLASVRSPRLGLVAGQRLKRQDSLSKKAASRFANGVRAALLADGTRDTGCGLKAFSRDAFLSLPYFNHMHRYLPALFAAHGFEIAHRDVSHRERRSGRSNYTNLGRAWVGIQDLLGVMWLLKRRKCVVAQEVACENSTRAAA